jgi:hypothetical protein
MFRGAKDTGYALGINLIGAMGGGAVEYLSMWLGMNSVSMIVLGIYSSAFALWMMEKRRRTGSKDRGQTEPFEAPLTKASGL